MAASNTRDCFRECIGLRVKGVLFGALPVGNPDIAAGTKTLVFEDGTGLTITAHGTYWRETAKEVSRAIQIKRDELDLATREIKDVLTAAGEAA